MRGGGGDDFEAALVLKFAEGADEIAVAGPPGVANRSEPVVIHPRQFAEGAVPVRAVDFLFRQFDEAVQVPLVTLAQQRVEQHRAQGRRERKRQARVHAVAPPAFQRLQQRQVGFGDGFKQPGFLQEFFVLGMPHKRQVRVQDEGQIALHSWSERCRHSSSLFEIHAASEPALNKAATPATHENGRKHKIKNSHGRMVRGTLDPGQTQFNHAEADQRDGDEANQHQGSAMGRVHEVQTFSGNGAFNDGSCGCAPTSPRYSVARLNFRSAARASVPSVETATAGKSYFPSGNAKR